MGTVVELPQVAAKDTERYSQVAQGVAESLKLRGNLAVYGSFLRSFMQGGEDLTAVLPYVSNHNSIQDRGAQGADRRLVGFTPGSLLEVLWQDRPAHPSLSNVSHVVTAKLGVEVTPGSACTWEVTGMRTRLGRVTVMLETASASAASVSADAGGSSLGASLSGSLRGEIRYSGRPWAQIAFDEEQGVLWTSGRAGPQAVMPVGVLLAEAKRLAEPAATILGEGSWAHARLVLDSQAA